jgi:hypothetical protein
MRIPKSARVIALALGFAWAAQVAPRDSYTPVMIALKEAPRLCDRVKPTKKTNISLASSPSQFWPSYDARVGNVTFSIGIDASQLIQYIQTTSSEFRTPDGVDFGWTYERLRTTFKNDAICETGWACFVELPSGWKAAVGGMTSGSVQPADKVGLFFLRGYCSSPPNTSLERSRDR